MDISWVHSVASRVDSASSQAEEEISPKSEGSSDDPSRNSLSESVGDSTMSWILLRKKEENSPVKGMFNKCWEKAG